MLVVAEQFFPVVDEFDRAFMNVSPSNDDEKDIDAAYRETYDALLKVLTDEDDGLGLTRVATVGEKFNPKYHEALFVRPDDKYDDDIICEEFQSGFMYGERLIRAPMVVVTGAG